MTWEEEVIAELLATSQHYEEIALLKAVAVHLQQLHTRLEQAEGELDGRLWSPKNW